MTSTLRIAFMGTPDFSVPALRALLDGPHQVVCVYTRPPRPKGRGQQVQPSPVQAEAELRGIPVFTPKSLRRDADARKAFAAHKLDIAIVAAYGLLLPPQVLAAPKYGCLNIHASLLPRWRGASPIQHAIWKGDAQSGVSLMQMDEGLDTGPVIDMRDVEIGPRATAPELHDALASLGAAMTVEALDRLAAEKKRLDSVPQIDELALYAPLLTKDDGRVNWRQTAAEIDRQARALNPWPGVWTTAGDKRLKILAVEPLPGRAGAGEAPGKIVDRQGLVACGENTALRLVLVQPENAKPMDAASAINGGYIAVGGIFSTFPANES